MSGTAPRSPGHQIASVTYLSTRDTKTLRTGSCSCDWSMTWLPDMRGGDPDQPWIDGWNTHRASVLGRRKPKVLGQGWVRMSLERA